MRKPSWMTLLSGIAVFSFFYLLTNMAIHRIVSLEQVIGAVEVGAAGGATTWFFSYMRWKRSQTWYYH